MTNKHSMKFELGDELISASKTDTTNRQDHSLVRAVLPLQHSNHPEERFSTPIQAERNSETTLLDEILIQAPPTYNASSKLKDSSKNSSLAKDHHNQDQTFTEKKKTVLRELWATLRSLKSNYDETKHAHLFQRASETSNFFRFRRSSDSHEQPSPSYEGVAKRSSWLKRRAGHVGGRSLSSFHAHSSREFSAREPDSKRVDVEFNDYSQLRRRIYSPASSCMLFENGHDEYEPTFTNEWTSKHTFQKFYIRSTNYRVDNSSDMMDYERCGEDNVLDDDTNLFDSCNSYMYQHEEFPPTDTKLYDSTSSSTALNLVTADQNTVDDISIDLNNDEDDFHSVFVDIGSPPSSPQF
ncbi:hypothetical protein C9374_010979 [Naegleria lovaniensis]|uniref:Uncharacterized protein n=1 Tax=Naegleria lovaniensis TaxID=51637 RepID=A0AA88GEI3_NAELO|nr:uncharacterized protein C9374_010979 [Naegleria lovaniensis]KAG2374142.1 hypothetical protein C9374_010979 [Naegleria lovaniensis]